MENQTTPIEKIGHWMKQSVMLKLATITILMLLLLIPASMIESIIHERESLNYQATQEVSGKWANSQQICGPIITLPLLYEYEKDDKLVEQIKWLYILPENLSVNGNIQPETLKRGIYEVVVYKSDLDIKGSFKYVPKFDQTNLKEIQWQNAFLTIGVSDMRGIKKRLEIDWDGQKLPVESGSRIGPMVNSGVTADLGNTLKSLEEPINFQFKVKLQGSKNISFVPVGGETNVNLKSSWHSPSFDGIFLPDNREVSEGGFTANWKVLELNRNFPQSFFSNEIGQKLSNTSFGVNLILPLDDYAKSLRSAKYAVMTIALTFLIFFMVEIINGRRIHPFQYTLVGLALCLFYVLLVSISEHSNFNTAYLVSSAAIVLMITLYSASIFKVRKLSMLLFSTLIATYGFLFVTLQLADFALLMGSIGLTIILGATMYFTRNIDWYKLNRTTEEDQNFSLTPINE